MGCDIHPYLDFFRSNDEKDEPYVQSFGALHISRDYALFAIMAGVRNYDNALEPIAEPRGLPEHNSYVVNGDNTLYITDRETDESGYTTRERAEKWVASGSSKWVNEGQTRVTHPDWHSHSWLTTAEMEEVIRRYVAYYENHADTYYRGRKPAPEVYGIVGAMKGIEADGKYTARLVYWFDN